MLGSYLGKRQRKCRATFASLKTRDRDDSFGLGNLVSKLLNNLLKRRTVTCNDTVKNHGP